MTPIHRILVIDDNSAIHEDFRKILGHDPHTTAEIDDLETSIFGRDPGLSHPILAELQMDTALQGQEALAMVQTALAEGRPYALAYVDGRMPPGWDGIETIGHLWKCCPDLQVVLCTAYADYSWEEIISRVGQCDNLIILKKPFDAIEVLQLSHALCRKWVLAQESQQLVHRLTLQLRAHSHFPHDTDAPAQAAANHELQARLQEIVHLSASLLKSALDPEQRQWTQTIQSRSTTLLGTLTAQLPGANTMAGKDSTFDHLAHGP